MMNICIVANGGQEQEVQDTRRNDLENKIDVLEGEIGDIDALMDHLREYDVDEVKDELRNENVSDSSLVRRLDCLSTDKYRLLCNLADIRNGLETRLEAYEEKLDDLRAEQETENQDVDIMWSTEEHRDSMWDSQEQDTLWDTRVEGSDSVWSNDTMWEL